MRDLNGYFIDKDVVVALNGEALSLSEFKKWINAAESAETISIKDAKAKWADKRKQLQKFIK